MKRASDLDDQLLDLDNRLKAMRKTAEQVPELQSKYDLVSRKLTAAEARVRDLEQQGEKMAATDTRLRDIERDLINRKAAMAELQGQVDGLKREKDALVGQAAKAREAADNRFAGIQLTGRRVVFLVDMSGSMKLTDESTQAPEKWPTVIDTISRVMKSLPDLEKFQVIVFSEDANYLIGAGDEWQNFDPETSVSRVRQAMAQITPKGNTNMFSAFELAFRFRAKGLDTIYLLSDGLPNIGPGLTLEQSRNLKDTERSELLGKYIRTLLKQRWNRPELSSAKVRVNSVGFFYESPDVGAFLWALSRENDGSFVGMSKP
jgi:Mg-chelatase subunit ChlD